MKHLLSALAMVAMISISARGEEVTFAFRGTVYELDGEFSYFTGHPFELVYSFERATEDANPGDPESGTYVGAIKSGTLTISTGSGSLTWVIEPGGFDNVIEIKNLNSADAYLASAGVSGPIGGNKIPAQFIVELTRGAPTALNNDGLPSSLDIQSFDQRVVRFTFISAYQHVSSTLGIITSFSFGTSGKRTQNQEKEQGF